VAAVGVQVGNRVAAGNTRAAAAGEGPGVACTIRADAGVVATTAAVLADERAADQVGHVTGGAGDRVGARDGTRVGLAGGLAGEAGIACVAGVAGATRRGTT